MFYENSGGSTVARGQHPSPEAERAGYSNAPCQLRLLAGQEHGRTIPLADIHRKLGVAGTVLAGMVGRRAAACCCPSRHSESTAAGCSPISVCIDTDRKNGERHDLWICLLSGVGPHRFPFPQYSRGSPQVMIVAARNAVFAILSLSNSERSSAACADASAAIEIAAARTSLFIAYSFGLGLPGASGVVLG
jgi:hypothetical protein